MYTKCQSDQNEIFHLYLALHLLLQFFMVYFIKFNQCSTKPFRIYIDPAWVNVVVIKLYFLIIDIYLCVIWDNQSLTCNNIWQKKEDQSKTYWADSWWRWITLDNLNTPQDAVLFSFWQWFTTAITQRNVNIYTW